MLFERYIYIFLVNHRILFRNKIEINSPKRARGNIPPAHGTCRLKLQRVAGIRKPNLSLKFCIYSVLYIVVGRLN